jgi:hypothetical protein
MIDNDPFGFMLDPVQKCFVAAKSATDKLVLCVTSCYSKIRTAEIMSAKRNTFGAVVALEDVVNQKCPGNKIQTER